MLQILKDPYTLLLVQKHIYCSMEIEDFIQALVQSGEIESVGNNGSVTVICQFSANILVIEANEVIVAKHITSLN